MKRIICLSWLGGLWLAVLLASVSCGTSPQTTVTPTGPAAVTIQNLAFSPALLTVPAGTTVTWTNNEAIAHTVTSNTGLFDSGIFNRGDTYSFTFNDKGIYEYHCTLHPTMKGKVTVE